MKKRIMLVQHFLKQDGLYTDTLDGLVGKNTLKGLAAIHAIDAGWSVNRKINGAIQYYAKKNGLEIGPLDGWWRPDTEEAFHQLSHLLDNGTMPKPWRPEDIEDVNPNNWPRQYTPEFDAFYGAPGENLVTIVFPYPMKLSWEPYSKVTRTSCHSKVKESLERVLVKVKDIYGLDAISELRLDRFGGCYNKRRVRGGTKWSMHSWAIALDFDHTRNKLEWGRDKAVFAKPEYVKWWEIWEEEGWLSLGRQRNFDWMHVQAAKL
jgi:hypothetical protein